MKIADNKNTAVFLLRLGLAFVFLYAAISSLRTPHDWIGYLPSFLRHADSAETLLKIFSIFELFLALWLLSGKYLKVAALVCVVMLFSIIVFNFSLFAITFRDIGLIFSAAALFFMAKR